MAPAAHPVARNGNLRGRQPRFAELFPLEDEAVRKQLMQAKVFLAYQRQLQSQHPGRYYIALVREGTYQDFEPATVGFEFSLEKIEVRAMELDKAS